MRTLLMTISVMFIASAASIAEIYSWKDSSGRTVYGDNPPENIATKTFTPEPLMIIPGYKDPTEDEKDAAAKKANKTNGDETETTTNDQEEETDEPSYATFKITYPTKDEVIRANDGRLFASMQLTPALAPSDTVSIYLNGKKSVANSKALSVQLEQLDRGKHNMFAVVRNANGDVLINSNTVTFSVLRNSVIK